MKKDPLILIGEQNPADFIFLKRALERGGLGNFRLTRDGAQVIDYLKGTGRFQDRQAHPLPDYLFLNFDMPKVSGLVVSEWIEKHRDSVHIEEPLHRLF
ncbi:MAG: hypothetical protein ACXWBP_06715 [Limisphaerales bacterium]